MLKFKEVKELLNRAKVALQQYRDFEQCYKGKKVGTIYNTRKRYFFEKLTTYENNLKSYGTGKWVTWEGIISYKGVNGKIKEERFVILLPHDVTKVEVEALIPFKVNKEMLTDIVILEVKQVDLLLTGELIFSREQ